MLRWTHIFSAAFLAQGVSAACDLTLDTSATGDCSLQAALDAAGASRSQSESTRLTQNFRLSFNHKKTWKDGAEQAEATTLDVWRMSLLATGQSTIAVWDDMPEEQQWATVALAAVVPYTGGDYAGITTDASNVEDLALPYIDGTFYVFEVLAEGSTKMWMKPAADADPEERDHPSGATVQWRLNYHPAGDDDATATILAGSFVDGGLDPPIHGLKILPLDGGSAYEFPVNQEVLEWIYNISAEQRTFIGVAVNDLDDLNVPFSSGTTAASTGLTGTYLDCTKGGKFGIDNEAGEVRVAFRSGQTEMAGDTTALVAHATTGEKGFQFGSSYDKEPTWATDGTTGATAKYNETTGILTAEKRGGYSSADAAELNLKGPGTLYTDHLDLADGDTVTVSSTSGLSPLPAETDFYETVLTGNFSSCIRQAALESIYMDKNLAPKSQQGGSTARTSTHDTEEVQNEDGGRNQLCHDVLTGKVLNPAPLDLPKGDFKVAFAVASSSGTTYSESGFADGFTLQYVHDDWYVADSASGAISDGCSVELGTDAGTGTGAGTAPTDAWFIDEDLNPRRIKGKVHATLPSGHTHMKVILEKVQAPGTWGFLLDDNDITHGPVDTLGANDAATGPYYGSGGSTGTAAPANKIDQGEGDTTIEKTAGGGPVGARAFNKHGDVIPGSARGEHRDYWEEEVVEVATFTTTTAQSWVMVEDDDNASFQLEKSQGSPPSPMYRFQVMSCSAANVCDHKRRAAWTLQVVDIGLYEPKATFFGDLDPKTRVLAGEITVVAPAFAMGLQGYRFYPTSDGNTNKPLTWPTDLAGDAPDGTKNAQFLLDLKKSCPPDSRNEGWTNANSAWQNAARKPCGNDNPYSPKCRGKSCPFINILPGSQGEFYISRFDNNGNADNKAGMDLDEGSLSENDADADGDRTPNTWTSNTARRNYGDNEVADIYFPNDGWLTPILVDVVAGDTLELRTDGSKNGACVTEATCTDVTALTLSVYHDIETTNNEAMIEWRTNGKDTAHGFTLIFQPDYPEMFMEMGTPMAQGASGFRVVSIYGSAGAAEFTADDSQDDRPNTGYNTEYRADDTNTGRNDRDADAYVETFDWLVPNVTCTPTTMHCPLPSTWAHINYTTPSLYPEPAEGSCLQQKTGTSSLSGCSDKVNLNDRWSSANSPTTSMMGHSAQNTNEEDNGQAVAADTYQLEHANWAGNCGDATSYFWFEKISCGSSRTFLTDRSLIQDFVQLTPTWEDIQQILDLYYTTKAPLHRGGATPGITFINADYHVAPVLPPKVNCTCLASMDAYASLLSVVSKTPTPGAPVTLDPEVLNTGTSKMVATLRMYQDPTYSIPATATGSSASGPVMPIVVSRFYLEVSTKFTRNRITISDCTSAHEENKLNVTDALKPRQNYCDNSTFDTQPEGSPNGVTHMDRISMKKFKYQDVDDVFMQCKIRACAQQPCGTCTGTGDARALSNVDLSPVEGEMFAPPVSVRLSPRDHNALVFGQPTGSLIQSTASASSVPAAPIQTVYTQHAIEISSQLVLSSVTASWAVNNRPALTSTLRNILQLAASEDLVITAINGARRARSLQAGVQIDFTVGVSDPARANAAGGPLTSLSSGSQALLRQFSAQLDVELESRGQPPVSLPVEAFSFSEPMQLVKAEDSSSFQLGGSVYSGSADDDTSAEPKSDTTSNSSLLIFLSGALCAALVLGMYYRCKTPEKERADEDDYADDNYAAKVADTGAVDFGFEEEI